MAAFIMNTGHLKIGLRIQRTFPQYKFKNLRFISLLLTVFNAWRGTHSCCNPNYDQYDRLIMWKKVVWCKWFCNILSNDHLWLTVLLLYILNTKYLSISRIKLYEWRINDFEISTVATTSYAATTITVLLSVLY